MCVYLYLYIFLCVFLMYVYIYIIYSYIIYTYIIHIYIYTHTLERHTKKCRGNHPSASNYSDWKSRDDFSQCTIEFFNSCAIKTTMSLCLIQLYSWENTAEYVWLLALYDTWEYLPSRIAKKSKSQSYNKVNGTFPQAQR